LSSRDRHRRAAQEHHLPDRRQAGEALEEVSCRIAQCCARVGKIELIKHQRYAHARQFKRANKSLRKLKTFLGRVIREDRPAASLKLSNMSNVSA
jgi:hypothetical protein